MRVIGVEACGVCVSAFALLKHALSRNEGRLYSWRPRPTTQRILRPHLAETVILVSPRETSEDQCRILAAEAEAIGHGDIDGPVARGVGDVVEVAVLVRLVEVHC